MLQDKEASRIADHMLRNVYCKQLAVTELSCLCVVLLASFGTNCPLQLGQRLAIGSRDAQIDKESFINLFCS